jgi:predicted transcriptional regulator
VVKLIKMCMNPTPFKILEIFPECNHSTCSELTKLSDGSTTSVLYGLAELKEKGLITLTKSLNNREKRYKLTQRGLIAKECYLGLLRVIS